MILFLVPVKVIFKSHWEKDDEWIVVIDELNEQLHEDSVKNNK